MPATLTSSGNWSQDHVDYFIREELLAYAKDIRLMREFANHEKILPGMGKQWKAIRFQRLDLPVTSLSEGVPPATTSVNISYVTATATQYGIVVEITDVLELTSKHPVLQKTLELVGEAMARLDDRLIQDTLLGNTNSFWAGTATSRATLTSSMVPDSVLARKIVTRLRKTVNTDDGAGGMAPPFKEDGSYLGVFHPAHEFDYQADSDWKNMAYRQNEPALEKGYVKDWMGVEFHRCTFMPEYTDLGNPTLADGAAVSGTAGMDGFKLTAANGTGTFLANTAYKWKVTRRHNKRGFEEGVSQPLSLTTANDGINTKGYTVVAVTATGYTYSVYVNNAASTALFRALADVAPASSSTVLAPLTTGTAAPSSLATTSAPTTVYPMYFFARDAFAVVDLDTLKSYLTSDKAEYANPLAQARRLGAKFMLGSLILNDNYMARAEAASAFG